MTDMAKKDNNDNNYNEFSFLEDFKNDNQDYLFVPDDSLPDPKLNIDNMPVKSSESFYADMDNCLLRGYYNLSGLAQRMFLKEFAVSKSAPLAKQNLGGKWYNGSSFYITDFLNDWKLTDGGQQRRNIIKAAYELSRFQIGFQVKGKDGEDPTVIFINIYQAVKVSPGISNSVTTYYSEPFFEILKTYDSGYTRLVFEQMLKIPCDRLGYNTHWYSYLSSYRHFQGRGGNEINRFYLKLTFDEIRKTFVGIGDNVKAKYSSDVSFRRGVIENPLKDINDAKVDIHVSWEYLKIASGSTRKYSAVKLIVELVDTWDFQDIGYVLKVFGNSPAVSKETRNMIIENKERFLDIARSKNKYMDRKIDFSNLENEANFQNIKTFFLEVATQLKKDLEEDEFFKASYISSVRR